MRRTGPRGAARTSRSRSAERPRREDQDGHERHDRRCARVRKPVDEVTRLGLDGEWSGVAKGDEIQAQRDPQIRQALESVVNPPAFIK